MPGYISVFPNLRTQSSFGKIINSAKYTTLKKQTNQIAGAIIFVQGQTFIEHTHHSSIKCAAVTSAIPYFVSLSKAIPDNFFGDGKKVQELITVW